MKKKKEKKEKPPPQFGHLTEQNHLKEKEWHFSKILYSQMKATKRTH